MQNPYIPYPVVVDKIITEVDTKDIKTFRFKFVNPEDEAKYSYVPGQFGELSIYGKGESPIGSHRRYIASDDRDHRHRGDAHPFLLRIARDQREPYGCGAVFHVLVFPFPKLRSDAEDLASA